MTVDRPGVAAFDFDGTLTRRDCVVPFLARFVGHPRALGRSMAALPELVSGVVRRDRDRLRATATRAALTGLPAMRVSEAGRRFGEQVAARRLRNDTTDRLRWHRAQGHRILIVSASYEVYLERVAEILGVDGVLGTRLGVDGAGLLTGRLDGPNCRAAEKVRRLDAWLSGQGLQRSEIELWVYGDSAGDRELLAIADHPVWAAGRLASVAAA